MKIKPEFYVDCRTKKIVWQTAHGTRAQNRTPRGVIHGRIPTRFHDLNIRDRAVTKNRKGDDGAWRESNRRIDRGLQPVAADAMADRVHEPAITRAEIASPRSRKGEA